MNFAPLRLKKDQDRRLRAGHCWIYSNEIDIAVTPLKAFEPGQQVAVYDHRSQWLGYGYVNPNTLICARLVSRDPDHALDAGLLVHRLNIALGLRERLYATPYYRLVFGESDGLPGLVVDRYGDVVVIQITTAGMEVQRAAILDAVQKVLKPSAVLLRNDSGMRELEGLELYVEEAAGTVPETLRLEEGGVRFEVSPIHGQKTGWFYDQADNRARLRRYVAGRRVLDVCSYVGAWGVQAASQGASEVLCVDVSQTALDAVASNARLNGLEGRVQTRRGDAFDTLKALRAGQERFDVVILDPPAFIKRKKDLEAGTLAYRRLNQAAMQLLAKDGLLITASCSYHMSAEGLLQVVQQGARHVDRSLQLLEQGHQAPDHPVHPAIVETAYLKAFYLRVLPTF